MLRIMLGGLHASERDGLIADDAVLTVGRRRVNPPGIQVRFGPHDEKGTRLMQHMQPRKADLAAIHDVDCAGLGGEQIESVHIVQRAV
jgi:hypothetical protein